MEKGTPTLNTEKYIMDAFLEMYRRKCERMGPPPEGYYYYPTNLRIEYNPYDGGYDITFDIVAVPTAQADEQ